MESKKRSKASEAWKYFTKNEPIDVDNPRATCNFCGRSYAFHSTRNGTITLNNYTSTCKFLLASLDANQKNLLLRKKDVGGNSSIASIPVKSFSQERCRDKLARMIILDELPFSIVEGNGFIDYTNELQPKFIVPCLKTVVNNIFKLFVQEKSKLQVFFSQLTSRVCLTTDTWTSIQNINYMVVSLHYIDENWTLHKKIINFVVIPDHKGETITMIMEHCLLEWGIERVLTIIVDNASPNEVALKHLVKNIKHWNELLLDGEFLHMRCFAHILNLIVCNGLKEHNMSIMRIRKAVKYVKSSPSRMQKFKTCVEMTKIICKNNVCLDVPTRWNSTYVMLDTAEKFKKAFVKLDEYVIQFTYEFQEDKDVKSPLTEEDWRVVCEFIVFLKVFYDATLKVSSTLKITANTFFSEVCKVHRVIKKYGTCDNLSLRTMALGMQTKYEKYWGNFSNVNHLMYVAVVLDPRYKLKFVKHCLLKLHGEEKMKLLVMDFEHTLRRLYSDYLTEPPTRNMEECSTSATGVEVMHDSMDDDKFEVSFQAKLNNEDEHDRKNELDHYFSEKLESLSDDSDILSWWKMHTSAYPTLSKIAKDVFVIPISTVASESAFSCSGRVLDSFQSSLAPKTVQGLIYTQRWIRAKRSSINIYELLDEIEKFEQYLDNVIAETHKE